MVSNWLKKNKQDNNIFCLLFDDKDLFDFKSQYKGDLPEGFTWFPLNATPMSQILYGAKKQAYFIPSLKNTDHEQIVKLCHDKKQTFLEELFSKDLEQYPSNVFPLEYFWWRIWIGIYRTIAYCNDLLNHFPVNEIILINRNSYTVEGGLLINNKSFINLIRDYFESRGVNVKSFYQNDLSQKPKTIFYSQKSDWKRDVLHSIRFFQWKINSFNKKNHSYILFNPGNENVINYKRPYMHSTDKSCPQAYHPGQLPFLHSAFRLFRFWNATRKLLNNKKKYKKPKIRPFVDTTLDFSFDFSEYFKETINQYVRDNKWMDNYINVFWNTCFPKKKPVLINFSGSPVHLDSFFLIKKIKSIGGKIATYQHGGYYSYTEDFFWRTWQDYTYSDYFLSFGKTDIKNIKFIGGFNNKPIPVELGSNVVARPMPNSDKFNGLSNSQGLYIPSDVSNFTAYPIDKASQFRTVKMIIDLLASFDNIKSVIKGLKGHKFHEELDMYIKRKSLANLNYSSVKLNKALSKQPKFVILNYSSTPLLQVLGKYSGPIFLLLTQPPLVKKEALELLRRRVSISENYEQFSIQLGQYFETGEIKDVDIMDNSFMDTYCKPFNYSIYEKFLMEATKA